MIGPAETECSRIVSEHGAGFVVANGQADMLVQRLRQLREDETLRREMGLRARQAFEKFYDRPVACGRIQTILAGREGQ
jgi:glycosyltransferase involved in cell wall biosynthesis